MCDDTRDGHRGSDCGTHLTDDPMILSRRFIGRHQAAAFAFAFTLGFTLPGTTVASTTPDKIILDDAECLTSMEIEFAANPAKAVHPKELETYLQGRKTLTLAEFQAITSGPPDSRPALPPHLPRQTGKTPRGAVAADKAETRFRLQEKIASATGKKATAAEEVIRRLRAQAQPGATWFTMAQLRNAEKFDFLTPTTPEQREVVKMETEVFDALAIASDNVLTAEENRRQGIRFPRIRRSWRDVLYDEDQSQPDRASKSLSDLEGALFSYTHDGNAETDTWNAHGAVIVPVTFSFHRGASFALRRFAFAPSVTYDRVTTNGNPAIEVNSLFYRAGVYMDFYGVHLPKDLFAEPAKRAVEGDEEIKTAFGYGLQVRASGVYVTDAVHRAEMPAFEADFEPRFHSGQKVALGYRMNLWPKIPARDDRNDDTILEAQIRVWLHMEGGDMQNAGPAWVSTADSFFRLGPTAQFTLSAPAFLGERRLSLTALYSYMAAISGPSDHPEYFRATLAYDLFRNVRLNHSVGMSLSYERGGLTFTKQEVDTLTFGLNVLF